jgi:hypothetical protein
MGCAETCDSAADNDEVDFPFVLRACQCRRIINAVPNTMG